MNLMLMVVFLVISVAPVYAQIQQPSADKLKADAQNVVKIISGDKTKTQTYCEMTELNDQAAQQQDGKRVEDLSQKINELQEKLGPEYVALVSGLLDIDPDSQDAQEIGSILEELDKLCAR
jgi:DNA repair ATPase RecN